MTTDLLQNKYASKSLKGVKTAPAVAPSAPARPALKNSRSLELTRDNDFLNGRHDIFDVLARHNEKDGDAGWDSNMNNTVALLERAKAMLSRAETTIREQHEHIRFLEDASGLCALTGLLNRRGFTKAFVREVARTNRGLNHGGLVVIFNLDNLERIENVHGAEAGQAAIKLVASALESEIREMDYAARIQHDEFVLLFSGSAMDKALGRLQHMALRLNKLSMGWQGHDIHLSLSLGLKSYGPGERAENIFKQASEDLSRNKKGSKTDARTA